MQNNTKFLSRFTMMLNEQEAQNLASCSVLVVGVGGVGGALAHMLARSGITKIGLVDFDSIDETNINRQFVAFSSNVGKLKIDELSKQMLDINPNIKIKKYPIKICSDTINSIDLQDYDVICDCIDDISAKKLLITQAKSLNKYIICSMGAGNRYKDIPQFEIADISKTSYDPIAKILRKFCSNQSIKQLDVCYTKQKAIKNDCNIIGSVVYYPVNMASVICAKVINVILSGGFGEKY